MQSLFPFALILPLTSNLFLHTLVIITFTTFSTSFTNTATAAAAAVSYPRASQWLSRREIPGIFRKNRNDDDDDHDDGNGNDIYMVDNPRNPPEITWLVIWRPLGDPPSSPRGHMMFLVEDDQNRSHAAADWEDGIVPDIASRGLATEFIDFNGIEDFTIKIMSPSAGAATVRFRRGVNLSCSDDPAKYPGQWVCVHKKPLREHVRWFLNSDD